MENVCWSSLGNQEEANALSRRYLLDAVIWRDLRSYLSFDYRDFLENSSEGIVSLVIFRHKNEIMWKINRRILFAISKRAKIQRCCLFLRKAQTAMASSPRKVSRTRKMTETARNWIYNFLLMFTWVSSQPLGARSLAMNIPANSSNILSVRSWIIQLSAPETEHFGCCCSSQYMLRH